MSQSQNHSHPFDADRELLSATARRHLPVLPVPASVRLSAAVDALTDPLRLPELYGVDPVDTADLLGVLRAVRARLLDTARHSPDPQQIIAAGWAARELGAALAALAPPAPGAPGTPATHTGTGSGSGSGSGSGPVGPGSHGGDGDGDRDRVPEQIDQASR